MVRTEALQAIESLVKTLLIAKKRGKLVHGAVSGPWGSGKTLALRELTRRYPLFYLKIPRENTSRTRLLRLIGFAIGAGAGGTYDFTLDLIKGHIQQEQIYPLIAIDEAQRVFNMKSLLDELKDLSEDPDLNFTYLFLGDHTLKGFLSAKEHHSLIKRILYKVEVSGRLDETVIDGLLREYNVTGDTSKLARIVRKRKWKILDLDNILYLASMKGVKKIDTEEQIEQILKATEISV